MDQPLQMAGTPTAKELKDAMDGHVEEVGYDVLVVALGSVARTLPIPGLAERGIAARTIGEAIYLRNHVISRLDLASPSG